MNNATKIFDFSERLLSTNSADDCWRIFCDFAEQLNLNRIVYSYGTKEQIISGTQTIKTQLTDGWMDYYWEEDYASNDPVSKLALESELPYLYDSYSFENQPFHNSLHRRVIRDAREAGINCGIGLPLRSDGCNSHGNFAIYTNLSLEKSRQLIQQEWNVCQAAMLITHMHHQSLMPEKTQITATIPQRQMELLKWISEGLQNDQIANKMNISIATVSHHMAALKKTIGVTHRREILPKALINGWLH